MSLITQNDCFWGIWEKVPGSLPKSIVVLSIKKIKFHFTNLSFQINPIFHILQILLNPIAPLNLVHLPQCLNINVKYLHKPLKVYTVTRV